MTARNDRCSGKPIRKEWERAILFWLFVLGSSWPPPLRATQEVPADLSEIGMPTRFTAYPPILSTSEINNIYPEEDAPDRSGLGIEPEFGSRDYDRLLGIRSYLGDRILYQEARRDALWTLEPSANYGWNYDSNIFQTTGNHVADWYQTLGTGLNFKLGKMSGRPEDLETIVALETNYSVDQEWFVSNPNLDALNQKGRIDLRIGRDDLIIRPYFTGDHITGTQILESERSGRYTSTSLEGGIIVEANLAPCLKESLDCSWGQIDQQSDANVGYALWKIYDELSYDLISNAGRAQDLRYTTESSIFTWLSAQNASANNRTGAVHYLLGGVGYRVNLSSSLTFSSKMGWENIEREWDTEVGRDLSTFCLEASMRYDYNRHAYVEIFWNRGYQLSQTEVDNNYIDNYITIAPTFKFDPGWYLSPGFIIGTTSSEQDEKTYYLNPSSEVGYEFPNQTKVKMRLEYNESRALGSTGGDVVGWRSTCSITLEF